MFRGNQSNISRESHQKRNTIYKHNIRSQSNKLVQPIKIPRNLNIFRFHPFWFLSSTTPLQPEQVRAKNGAGVSYIIDFYRGIFEKIIAHHLFELIIRRMPHHRLCLSGKLRCLNLPFGVAFKIATYRFNHSKSLLLLAHVYIRHSVA